VRPEDVGYDGFGGSKDGSSPSSSSKPVSQSDTEGDPLVRGRYHDNHFYHNDCYLDDCYHDHPDQCVRVPSRRCVCVCVSR